MGAFGNMDAKSVRAVGAVTAAAAALFCGFTATVDFDARGREFVVLGGLRLVFAVALVALASLAARRSKLLTWGLYLAAFFAVANLLGGIGAVVTDGWWYEPFAEGSTADPPWYAYVIGLSAFGFALGALLTGIGAWRAGVVKAGLAAALGGLIYPIAFTGGVGHAVWALAWLVLGVLLFMGSEDRGHVAAA